MELPSAPKQFIRYMEEADRPQVQADVDYENGMGVSVGRLREDKVYDFKFIRTYLTIQFVVQLVEQCFVQKL